MKKFLSLLVLACPVMVWGQPNYPQHYFRNPLDIPIYLAGNFGECRPGHFHSGVDIKTQGKEGQPVHAAADGYISRIKMDKSGFGHGLYITHPNGYTTLYGHLSDFAPAIQKYMHAQQYAQQRWDVDLQLSPTQFPVKKGQLIALSGNTGGSTAPHLHFEIRDGKTEHPLNPEQFGLPIIDKKAPVPIRAVVYNLSNGFYNSYQHAIVLHKINNIYTEERENVTFLPAAATDTMFGIGLEVNDYMEGSDNTLAHYKADLFVNDSFFYSVVLDNIGYDETKYINAYADYPTKKKDGFWVQSFFQLPGNHLNSIYKDPLHNKGYLHIPKQLSDTQPGIPYNIKIVLTDDFGNTATVAFSVSQPPHPFLRRIDPNNLHPSKILLPNAPNTFESPNLKFELNDRALYDSVAYTYNEQQDDNKLSAIYKICSADIPMHTAMQLSIKPNKPISFNLRDKIVMMYTDGKDEDGQAAGNIDMGWYKAAVRSFGTYWLAADTLPPTIKPLQKEGANLNKAKQILFAAKDNMTSVRKFKGMLDGKWICIEQHGDLLFYTFDEHCSAGKHKLVLSAADENNNEAKITYTFTR
ncbi:MAG: M23 family metallopeptidase [Flavipsychrobacter sp.]|nr:M23 family metallopeptidase [Flavipsychrobacter sp.]